MFNIINKNKNYKLLIGLLIGFIFSSGIVVYAWYNDYSSEVSYDNSSDWLLSTNVHDAIVELARQKNCPLGYDCYQKKSTLAVGDYVSYTPSSSSYEIDLTKTGGTTAQSINPSELNLWRVLSINGDGTVDIISEYVSSTRVWFNGTTGYKNLVGYLNVIASQYETAGITVGSRHFGYNGQTEYITDETYFVVPPPWPCYTNDTSPSCTVNAADYEEYGGGDILYLADYNLVTAVIGTNIANSVENLINAPYWMASREYYPSYQKYTVLTGRVVSPTGVDTITSIVCISPDTGSTGFNPSYQNSSVRPIITLSATLTYFGVGNKAYPMEITN